MDGFFFPVPVITWWQQAWYAQTQAQATQYDRLERAMLEALLAAMFPHQGTPQ